MSLLGQKALEYCRKHPDMATRTLAKKMHKETGLFSSIEHARGALRRYRGQSGDSGRRLLRHRDACTENGDSRRNGHEGGVEPAAASVLLFDIETSPNLAYVWRTFKEYIAPEQMIEETKVICWSAKWLGDDHVMFDSIESDMPTPVSAPRSTTCSTRRQWS